MSTTVLPLTPMRIGSELVAGTDETSVLSPYDGRVVGRVPVASEAHVESAVATARALHRSGSPPAWRRAEVLDRAAGLLAERREVFARIIASEAAKPIRTARNEVERAVETFRFSATVARTITGETVPLDAAAAGVGKLGFVMRVPVGVVAAVSPFNFPLNLVAHKVAPAIAVGCPVVLKPASSTPLSALALASLLLDECGLEPGWLQVLTMPGSAARRLVEHPDVAMVTFTGSPEVGWEIRANAARKRVSLELGNNAPVIVEPDAANPTTAAKVAAAGFAFAGQSCISVQRVLVHRSVQEVFTEALVAAAEDLVVGDPLDEATDVSSLISPSETNRVRVWIHEAVGEGATLCTGGDLGDGQVLRPTVLTDVRPEMRVCHTEVFGPVVGVQAYDDLDEAVALANDTRYGLQAAVFTNDLGRALRAVTALDFGGVMVNEVPTWRADHMPYGGVRDSGNTKEGPAWTAREMTVERMVVLHHG